MLENIFGMGLFFNVGMFFDLLLEFICCYFIVGIFCEKRKYKHEFVKSFILLFTATVDYVVMIALYSYIPIKMVVSFSVFLACMYLIYDAKLSRIFISTALLYGLLACVDIFGMAFIKYVFKSTILDFTSQQITRDSIIMGIIRIALLSVILCMKLKIEKYNDDMIGKKELFGIIAISTITVISSTIICLNINDFKDVNVPTAIGVGLIAIDFILFFLIESILQREKTIREAQIIQEKTKHELSTYYSISENLDEQRKWSHEFKNHISCIYELARNGALNELKDYVGRIDVKLSERADMVDTNNVIVNAIINTKYREAQKRGIVFVLKVNDLSGIALSDMEVVTILSNLLNNAIEACEECEEKVIKLKFVMEKMHTIISVKNTMAKKPVHSNGIFETVKSDAKMHGMGIRNVCDILEKYNAKYQIDYDENEFSFSIVI